MSRFPETVAEAIDQVVIGESLHVEDLAEHIAAGIVERQQAVRSEVTIRAKFPVTRRTPVSDLPTQEIYHLIGRALVNGTKPRRMVGVEVRGLNACPCAQAWSARARRCGCARPAMTTTRSTRSSSCYPQPRTTSGRRPR